MSKSIAVVGGGISGIAAAFQLQRAGHEVTVIESSDCLGGRFGVGLLGERQVMLGGKNIGERYHSFRSLVDALGDYAYEPFGINTSRLVDGKLVTVDSNHRLRSLRVLASAGSLRDVARFVSLAVRSRRGDTNRFLGSRYFTGLAEYSDQRRLDTYFGTELVRNILRPMTVRMNGAEPDEMYLGTFGTNIGMMDTYDQLIRGIGPVLDAFAKMVDLRLNSTVEGLVVRDGGVRGLQVAGDGAGTEEIPYDGVVVATPAYAAAEILKAELPNAADLLGEVRYFPATVVLIEYDRPVFTPEIRAIALDGGPCSNIGAYGVKDRHIARYTFSGRLARPLPSAEQLDEWLDDAEAILQRHLVPGEVARVRRTTRQWKSAYCGYLPFHGDFLAKLNQETAPIAGLELAGDYLRGVSLEACTRAGYEAATALTRSCSTKPARY
ncbi:protoporphyrinogen/coproporphyrinogen oxidase [Nocardia brasiliensis]|uniref:protoporphyrinogen/coproporphyrinogen oxidase n=1 Tax=Nocardia brasiliensis TaxID=37326 RepID=UPI002454A2BF|nr:FAD-dependent oxidoreductase [Nocardia brasiliensis]